MTEEKIKDVKEQTVINRRHQIKCVGCSGDSTYWLCEDCVVEYMEDEKSRTRNRTKKRTAKAIFDERSEVWIMNAINLLHQMILHQMIHSDKTDIKDMKWILGKLENQLESDEELKKKWCDD